MESEPLLSVRELRIAFDGVEAVRGLSFDVRPREALAIVGESGAGKSLTARALLGMLPRGATSSGTITPDLSAHRGRRISLVPQDALSALSPVHPVGDHSQPPYGRCPESPAGRPGPGRSRPWTASASPTRHARRGRTRTSTPAACGSAP
ncbi:hypothetical protein GCM10011428_32070 [Streptomyces violaceus]|uniref:ATP-binding cassette domain-containing protein n=1 Tax=Streptomyces violaceus TaxID=1936 RepID=UPI0031E725D9